MLALCRVKIAIQANHRWMKAEVCEVPSLIVSYRDKSSLLALAFARIRCDHYFELLKADGSCTVASSASQRHARLKSKYARHTSDRYMLEHVVFCRKRSRDRDWVCCMYEMRGK